MKKVILTIIFTFLTMFLSSCDAGEKGKGKPLTIPKGTALVTFIFEDGSSESFLPNGKKLLDCVLCPKGDNEKCAKDTSKKYCKGLVNATISNVHTRVIIDSSVNPFCKTEIINGESRQRCYCLPGEVHELCN